MDWGPHRIVEMGETRHFKHRLHIESDQYWRVHVRSDDHGERYRNPERIGIGL